MYLAHDEVAVALGQVTQPARVPFQDRLKRGIRLCKQMLDPRRAVQLSDGYLQCGGYAAEDLKGGLLVDAALQLGEIAAADLSGACECLLAQARAPVAAS